MTDWRLFVDIMTIQSLHSSERGIPRYATELSRALLASRAPIAALALNPMLPWPDRIHPDLASARELTWNTARAFRRARSKGPLVSLVLSPFELCRPVLGMLAPHVVGSPQAVLVHDLIPERLDLDEPDSSYRRMYEQRRRSMRCADLLLTPSKSTQHDLIELWGVDPARTAVVGEAVSPFFCPREPGDDDRAWLRRRLPRITRPFVLCVSGWAAHKNTETLIDAWARLEPTVRQRHQLVVACSLPDEGRRTWAARAERRGLGPEDVVLTGFVEDPVLRSLYRTAVLFVLPSRYEGFGLPVLEAAACGCPAITSNTSSLPEILDWSGATFSPDDADQIAALLERAVTNEAFRSELRAVSARATERHTWPRVVDALLSACDGLPEPAPLRHHRLRLALVGPFPPTRSWVATYNERVAEQLAQLCELDCFAERAPGPRVRTRRDRRRYRKLPAASLSTFNPSSYDAVLYAIDGDGESNHLARTHPGLVWLHDLSLADSELLAGARGLIVGSEQARSVVERASVPGRTWTVPLAVPEGADPALVTRDAWAFDDVARRILAIAAVPPVNESAA